MDNCENLQVGDKVIIRSGGIGRWHRIGTVEKVQKIHVLVGGVKYSRRNGWRAGSDFGSISPASEEDIREIKTYELDSRLTRQLEDIKWRNISVETKQKVIAMLTARATPQDGKEAGE